MSCLTSMWSKSATYVFQCTSYYNFVSVRSMTVKQLHCFFECGHLEWRLSNQFNSIQFQVVFTCRYSCQRKCCPDTFTKELSVHLLKNQTNTVTYKLMRRVAKNSSFVLDSIKIDLNIMAYTILLEKVTKSPFRCIYRFNPLKIVEAKLQIKGNIHQGWTEPNNSPYSSLILFFQKKNVELGIVINYWVLNKQMIKNWWSFWLIGRILCIKFIKVGSKLIMKSKFRKNMPLRWHLEFHPVIISLKFSFGLSYAPATLQRMMNQNFPQCLWKKNVYLDDILMLSFSL